MNARHELAREAERILLDAGCASASAKHWGPWWTVSGMRADEREVSGHTRDQADPQDPRDLARRLAAQLGPKPEIEEIPEAPETVEETFPPGEGPFDPALAEQPEASETPQDETHGETGEEASGADAGARVEDAGDDASRGQALANDGGVVGSEGAAWEPDAEQPADEPIDADYTLPEIELIEPDPNPDFGAEVLAMQLDMDAAIEPTRDDAAGAFIFGDNLHQMRTAAIGLVMQHALALMPEPTDYARLSELRNFTLGVSEDRWPDDPAKREELDVLEATERRRHQLAMSRDEKVGFLMTADREAIEAFDCAAGWP